MHVSKIPHVRPDKIRGASLTCRDGHHRGYFVRASYVMLAEQVVYEKGSCSRCGADVLASDCRGGGR